MLKLNSSNSLYPLWTALLGFISYAVTGFVINLLNKNDEMLLLLLSLCGLISGLILGVLLEKARKLILIAISSAIGLVVSLVVGFALGYILPSVLPFLGETVHEIMSSIIMLIIFGLIMAPSLNGFKAIPFFILICGILAVIFGAISVFTLFGEGYLPAIVAPFGLAIGLCSGLYVKRQNVKK